MRKRVFYSVYVLDRFISVEFGSPLLLAQIDIDICLPGAMEIHGTGSDSRTISAKRKRAEDDPSSDHIYPSNPAEVEGENHTLSPLDQPPATPSFEAAQNRLFPAFSIVQFALLTGRLIETFNRSRRWRVADRKLVQALNQEK
jgi:hypothetical protein